MFSFNRMPYPVQTLLIEYLDFDIVYGILYKSDNLALRSLIRTVRGHYYDQADFIFSNEQYKFVLNNLYNAFFVHLHFLTTGRRTFVPNVQELRNASVDMLLFFYPGYHPIDEQFLEVFETPFKWNRVSFIAPHVIISLDVFNKIFHDNLKTVRFSGRVIPELSLYDLLDRFKKTEIICVDRLNLELPNDPFECLIEWDRTDPVHVLCLRSVLLTTTTNLDRVYDFLVGMSHPKLREINFYFHHEVDPTIITKKTNRIRTIVKGINRHQKFNSNKFIFKVEYRKISFLTTKNTFSTSEIAVGIFVFVVLVARVLFF